MWRGCQVRSQVESQGQGSPVIIGRRPNEIFEDATATFEGNVNLAHTITMSKCGMSAPNGTASDAPRFIQARVVDENGQMT
jgi:hypothetical protein